MPRASRRRIRVLLRRREKDESRMSGMFAAVAAAAQTHPRRFVRYLNMYARSLSALFEVPPRRRRRARGRAGRCADACVHVSLLPMEETACTHTRQPQEADAQVLNAMVQQLSGTLWRQWQARRDMERVVIEVPCVMHAGLD